MTHRAATSLAAQPDVAGHVARNRVSTFPVNSYKTVFDDDKGFNVDAESGGVCLGTMRDYAEAVGAGLSLRVTMAKARLSLQRFRRGTALFIGKGSRRPEPVADAMNQGTWPRSTF